MPQPKSILKKTSSFPDSTTAKSKPTGSKLKHSIALPSSASSSKKMKPVSATRPGILKAAGGHTKTMNGTWGGKGKGKAIEQPRKGKFAGSKRDRDESGDDDEESDNDFGQDDGEDEEDDQAGTDEEIEKAQRKGEQSTTQQNAGRWRMRADSSERKRPTTAEDFGSALTSLLTESTRPAKQTKPSKPSAAAPTHAEPTKLHGETKASKFKPTAQPILSLSRAPLPRTLASTKLDQRAARQLKHEKDERQDRARVMDVVEGWSHQGNEGAIIGGLEFEKGLKKTAQRGVIKLFNAILTASRQAPEDDSQSLSTNPKHIPTGVKGYGKKDKDNILGRGAKEGLTKEGFLELVKRGG